MGQRVLRRGSVTAAVIATVLAAGCGGSDPDHSVKVEPGAADDSAAISGWFLRANQSGGVIMDLSGDRPPLSLVAPGRPLFQLGPTAVPHPSRDVLVYSSWGWTKDLDGRLGLQQQFEPGEPAARPSVRGVDLSTGRDEVVVDGAHGVALAADGLFATVVGTDPYYYVRFDVQDLSAPKYPAHVVVRDSLDAPGEQWTEEPADYQVFGWAGEKLIATRLWPGTEGIGDLLVLGGPGEVEVLAKAMGPLAISPDGSTLLAGTRYAARDDGTLAELDELRMVLFDLDGMREVGSIDLAGEELAWVTSASWLDDAVVVSGAVDRDAEARSDEEPYAQVLVVFAAPDPTTVRLEEMYRLPAAMNLSGVHDAFVLDDAWVAGTAHPGDRKVKAGADYPDRELIRCPLQGGTCEFFELDAPTNTYWDRVHNPSRPVPADRGTDATGLRARELL